MKKSYALYALAVLGMCVAAIVTAGVPPLVFADPPSIAIIVGVPLVLLLGIVGPREIVDAFRHAGASSTPAPADIRRALVVFNTAQRLVLTVGVLFTMLGILMTLYGLSRDTATPVAFYMVIAFQTVLYAILVTLLVIMPFRAALEKKLAAFE